MPTLGYRTSLLTIPNFFNRPNLINFSYICSRKASMRKTFFLLPILIFINSCQYFDKQVPSKEELLQKECPSSFTSIAKTLKHISDTQLYWSSMIRETPTPQFDYGLYVVNDAGCAVESGKIHVTGQTCNQKICRQIVALNLFGFLNLCYVVRLVKHLWFVACKGAHILHTSTVGRWAYINVGLACVSLDYSSYPANSRGQYVP